MIDRGAKLSKVKQYLCPLIFIAVTQAACTAVHVHEKGAMETSYFLGVPVVRLDSTGNDSTIVDIKGFGIVSTPTGLTVGWVDQIHAAVPADSRCQVVIWLRNFDEISRLLQVLEKNNSSLNNICLFEKRG